MGSQVDRKSRGGSRGGGGAPGGHPAPPPPPPPFGGPQNFIKRGKKRLARKRHILVLNSYPNSPPPPPFPNPVSAPAGRYIQMFLLVICTTTEDNIRKVVLRSKAL